MTWFYLVSPHVTSQVYFHEPMIFKAQLMYKEYFRYFMPY